jgi:hypothetical protein
VARLPRLYAGDHERCFGQPRVSELGKTPDQAGEPGYNTGKNMLGCKPYLAVDGLGPILGLTITTEALPDRDGAKTVIEEIASSFGRL